MKKTLLVMSMACAHTAIAGDVSEELTVSYLRPYYDGSVFVIVTSAPAICNTTAYKIPSAAPGAEVMYAAALSALGSGKKVKVELSTTTGCIGWGTELQSFYILK